MSGFFTSNTSGAPIMAPVRLHNDFREFLKLLNANDVRFLLVGGYAVGYHGYPRATNDLDIWIDADRANLDRVLVTLEQFGFAASTLATQWIEHPHKILRLGYPPVRIEIMTTISGVEFEAAYRDRLPVNLDGVEIGIIGREALVQNKKAAGRHKDLDDLEHLSDISSD